MIIYVSISCIIHHSYSTFDILNSSNPKYAGIFMLSTKSSSMTNYLFTTFVERCLIHSSVFTYNRNMQMNPIFISVDFIYIKTLHIVYAVDIIILFWNLIMHLWRLGNYLITIVLRDIWKSTIIILATNNKSILKSHRSTDIYVIHSK